MDDIFPFPTGAAPKNIDRAASIALLNTIRPMVAQGSPSPFICDCLRKVRTGSMGAGDDELAESLCEWIAALLDGDNGPSGLVRYALGLARHVYVDFETRDVMCDKMQRTRVAWIDWMIQELKNEHD